MIPLPVVFVIGIGATRHAPAGRIAVFALATAVFVALVALSGVVRQIFAVALYRYAAENDTSAPFREQDLRAPFTKGRNRQTGTWLSGQLDYGHLGVLAGGWRASATR